MRKIYIESGATRRMIGQAENGIFVSRRRSSKHLYRKLDAWGIDCKALEGMVRDIGLHTVRIVDIDTELTYATHTENFKLYGTVLHFKPHRTQVFLPLKYWTVEEKWGRSGTIGQGIAGTTGAG